jgi:hypothetical protein
MFVDALIGALAAGIGTALYLYSVTIQPMRKELREAQADVARKAQPLTCECDHCGQELIKVYHRAPERRGTHQNEPPSLVWVHQDSMQKQCGFEVRCATDD